jgi:hypothetical protein
MTGSMAAQLVLWSAFMQEAQYVYHRTFVTLS